MVFNPQGVGGGRAVAVLVSPTHPLWVFNPQGVGGGESSGKRKFCYKVATQREPGGCRQKVQKKKTKKLKKNEKNEKVDKAHRKGF